MRRGTLLRVAGGPREWITTLLGIVAGGQGCDEAPYLGLRSFGVEKLGTWGVGELGTCGSWATFSFRVSLEFPIHSLLVSESGQGFPIRVLLVSDSVLLWFPNRFPLVSDSRLGFRLAFCWFPIRLSLGFRFVSWWFPIRFLSFRFGFADFRFGVSDSLPLPHNLPISRI